MLGHSLFRYLGTRKDRYEVVGTVRRMPEKWPWPSEGRLLSGVHAKNFDTVVRALAECRPTHVVNCIGVVKQLDLAKDPLAVLPINSVFPHRLADLCRACGARMVHISTDCVFDGAQGNYTEDDPPTARDLYGLSKYLGEVRNGPHITLRTSIIGHELTTRHGLVEWFLSQESIVQGYTKAIYTGFPTTELARILDEHVLDRPDLVGLYHVSSAPISKYKLLQIIGKCYGRRTTIVKHDEVVIDRSLDSSRFRSATGYNPPSWEKMIARMNEEYKSLTGSALSHE
jgi:dTDP-4-dehydrorhamnose reductase